MLLVSRMLIKLPLENFTTLWLNALLSVVCNLLESVILSREDWRSQNSQYPKKALPDEVEVIDPSPEFNVEINEAFAGMMNKLRGYRGQIKVQAEFGRIILRKFDKKKITNKEIINLVDRNDVQRLLYNPSEYGPTCVFTSVLTTFPSEIAHILAIKDKSGELWVQDSPKWNVSYKFTFTDQALDTRFTIEIDAETFNSEVKAYREVANIFVHGTKRYNDYRIVATGYESLDDRYGYIAIALESSLWIP